MKKMKGIDKKLRGNSKELRLYKENLKPRRTERNINRVSFRGYEY